MQKLQKLFFVAHTLGHKTLTQIHEPVSDGLCAKVAAIRPGHRSLALLEAAIDLRAVTLDAVEFDTGVGALRAVRLLFDVVKDELATRSLHTTKRQKPIRQRVLLTQAWKLCREWNKYSSLEVMS